MVGKLSLPSVGLKIQKIVRLDDCPERKRAFVACSF